MSMYPTHYSRVVFLPALHYSSSVRRELAAMRIAERAVPGYNAGQSAFNVMYK